jgi:polyisoprenoid-binding protein YceI
MDGFREVLTMRLKLTLALAIALTAAAARADPVNHDPAKLPPGRYVLDKHHASLTVKIPHMGGFSRYTLRFDGLDGGFAYDPADWRRSKLTFTVDPRSVDTNDAAFNKQIAGYFEPAKYPVIRFVSTAIEGGEGGKGQVKGELTLHGVTRPVVLDVAFNGSGPGISSTSTRVGFSGMTRIKRSDFGVSNMMQYAGDELDVIFEVEFEKT